MAADKEIQVARLDDGSWVDVETGEVLVPAGSNLSALLVKRHFAKRQSDRWARDVAQADAVLKKMREEGLVEEAKGIDATGQVEYSFSAGRNLAKLNQDALKDEYEAGEWTEAERTAWRALMEFKNPTAVAEKTLPPAVADTIRAHRTYLPSRGYIQTIDARFVHP